ncbi:MAG: type II toxin-antitoxin system RelE/ParE family toxin [Chloroflexota bacterium]
MEFIFKNKDLEKIFLDKRALTHKYGPRMADLFHQRLAEIVAFENLEQLKSLPAPRLHALKGNRKGQFSLDLVHPLRLIIESAVNLPLKTAAANWSKITKVYIIEIADTHE